MIILKSIREIPKDIDRVILVARKPPKGWKFEHIPDLGPSLNLLYDYKSGRVRWINYVLRYRMELMSKESLKIVQDICNSQIDSKVCLCCYCSDINRCHLKILGNLFSELGVEIN